MASIKLSPLAEQDVITLTDEPTMTTSHVSLFTGLMVGFSIAVPIGPMGLLCIRRTLASGMSVGVSTGMGAATVNVFYGALIILGLDKMTPLLVSSARVLSFAGGIFLLWWAVQTLRHRHSLESHPKPAALSPFAAYGSAVAFNAINPISPVLIVSLLSPIVGSSAPSLSGAVAMLFGMFMAATIWWVCLSGSITMLRSRLTPRMLMVVNQAAGAVLTFYGAMALARSAGM